MEQACVPYPRKTLDFCGILPEWGVPDWALYAENIICTNAQSQMVLSDNCSIKISSCIISCIGPCCPK